MRNLRKFGTLALAVSMAGFVAATAAGCSDAVLARSESLNDRLTTAVVQMDETVRDFKFTGADVDKAGFEYDVSFNGVASLEGEEKAFADLHYSVPHSVFLKLSKDSSAEAVYDVFDYIVDNLKPEELNLTKVSNIEKFNDAIVRNTPSPFEKYRVERGFVYNLGDPVFDDASNSVSFDVKTIMELRKDKVRPGFGLGIGFSGHIGFGVGLGLYSRIQEGTFMTMDTYSLSFSDEDYALLKADPNFIYEIAADAIGRGDESFMSVKRQYTNDVTYDNADLLDKLDFNSAVDQLEM